MMLSNMLLYLYNSNYPVVMLALVVNYYVYVTYKSPFKQGFSYSDVSLNKPFVWPLTITFYTLLAGTSLLPMSIIFVTETFCFQPTSKESATLKFLFGWTCCCIFNNFVKNQVGGLRPHFLAANSLKFDPNDQRFHADFKPVDLSARGTLLAKESRHSFFSGHSMLGMYAACYLIIFLQENMATRNLYVHGVQFALLMAGVYPGITQGRNYWHHWSDVAVGQSLGLVAAFIVNYYVL